MVIIALRVIDILQKSFWALGKRMSENFWSAVARIFKLPNEGWASQLTDYAFSCPVRIQSNLLGAKT
jgi:hypothetical protein